jgi:hypothetical protein
MPDETPRRRLSTRGSACLLGPEKRGKHWASLAVAAFGALAGLGLPEGTEAQQAEPFHIGVSATIVVAPASLASLGIEVGPSDALPRKSFIGLRGLPPTVLLSQGQSIGSGSWTVPVTALAALKANIPDNLSGRSEIVISLISIEGALLAVAKTVLVIGPPASLPPAEKTPPAPPSPLPTIMPPAAETPFTPVPSAPVTSSPPTEAIAEPAQDRSSVVAPPTPAVAGPSGRRGNPTSPQQELSTEERQLAEKLVAQGERYLNQADVVSARLLFRRAAEKGLALAAIRLAATFDPAELSRLKVEGVAPDQTEARKWYERARELGVPEAEEHLARLGGR